MARRIFGAFAILGAAAAAGAQGEFQGDKEPPPPPCAVFGLIDFTVFSGHTGVFLCCFCDAAVRPAAEAGSAAADAVPAEPPAQLALVQEQVKAQIAEMAMSERKFDVTVSETST